MTTVPAAADRERPVHPQPDRPVRVGRRQRREQAASADRSSSRPARSAADRDRRHVAERRSRPAVPARRPSPGRGRPGRCGSRRAARAGPRARPARPGAPWTAASSPRRPRPRTAPPAPARPRPAWSATNRSCPGTSTNATSPPGAAASRRSRGRWSCPRRRSSAQPVGLHAGERPHQRRLAVVDVAGGGDDVHVGQQPRGGPHAAARRVVGRVDGPQVEQAAAAGDPADAPAGRRPAAAGAYGSGRLTAALGRATPGAPPPPTAASLSTTVASTRPPAAPWPAASARTRSATGSAARNRATGTTGPRSVASSAASVSLSTRSARASGCRRSRSHDVGPAEQQPRLRAAEQLVAAGGHQVRAGPQRRGRVRLVRQHGGAPAGRSRCRRPPARPGWPARRRGPRR